jgi:hypothetical protein
MGAGFGTGLGLGRSVGIVACGAVREGEGGSGAYITKFSPALYIYEQAI